VAALSRVYPGAQTLVGPAARAATLSGSLNRSDLVHIAAHGTFRADNPLFSSLRLVDGPLTVYDLERLSAAPRRVVLSACDAGQSLVATGDELMGLSAAMLSLGTRTLVASVAAVSDATTSSMMVDFHRALAAGTAPAEALADTQAAFRRDGRESLARTAGFVCFGAG
jgi:CHAT domain-containing protein